MHILENNHSKMYYYSLYLKIELCKLCHSERKFKDHMTKLILEFTQHLSQHKREVL